MSHIKAVSFNARCLKYAFLYLFKTFEPFLLFIKNQTLKQVLFLGQNSHIASAH